MEYPRWLKQLLFIWTLWFRTILQLRDDIALGRETIFLGCKPSNSIILHCIEFVPSIMEAHKLKIYFLANQRSSWDPIDQLWCWILLSIWLKMSILWSLSYYSLVRGLNSPFRTTQNVEILNIICCRQESEILSTVVLFKNLMIYILKLFINKSREFYFVKCVY